MAKIFGILAEGILVLAFAMRLLVCVLVAAFGLFLALIGAGLAGAVLAAGALAFAWATLRGYDGY